MARSEKSDNLKIRQSHNYPLCLHLLLAAALAGWMVYQGLRSGEEKATFAGSESCRRCHPRQYELWHTSPHANNIRRSRTTPFVWEIGRTNILQYVARMPDGSLQISPWAWDLRKGEYFHAPSENVRPWIPGDSPLPWIHPAWNFTANCERCHIAPAGNPENTITCEGCHGPMSKHVKAPHLHKPKRLGAESCRRCHWKGTPITRHMLVYDLDFTADGRDLGENYTWGTWSMRSCRGITCLTCHTSSGRLRHGDNPSAACLACHGNIDLAAHSRHAASIQGRPNCLSCHMPKTSFGRIPRSDHSFRAPDPQMALLYGGQSACAACHARSEEENARIVEAWHPVSPMREMRRRRAALVDQARKGNPEALSSLSDCQIL